MATPAPLFLDAARLGAMSPTAQLAARDFARLAGEGLSTLYWEEFFRGRFSCAARFPGLKIWRGIAGLQADIRELLAVRPSARVVFAARTALLMDSAVEWLASRSHRIFTTDTLWPRYRDRLKHTCRSRGAAISVVRLRENILTGQVTPRRLAAAIFRHFVETDCDGVCLSSVSHDGIQLPLAEFIYAVRRHNPGAFIVIDGAQQFAHVPVRLADTPPDVYIAGCHKWLRASQPLAIGVLPNRRTAAPIERHFRQHLDDPLFHYVQSLQGRAAAPAETVNLAPLVCAQGALADIHEPAQWRGFRGRLQNVRRAAKLAEQCGWTAVRRPCGVQTGILMLSSRVGAQSPEPAELQRHFAAAGIVLTAYEGGYLRLALPKQPLPPRAWSRLGQALAACAMAPIAEGASGERP